MGDISIERFNAITPEILDLLVQLEQQVFPSPLSEQVILKELTGRKDVLALIASDGDVRCGYKVGFQHSPDIYYSWVGGVIPEHRRRGIATNLIRLQHQILKEMGYKYVRTSTKNKYREMLMLNLKVGFDITGVQKKLNESEQSIILEKKL